MKSIIYAFVVLALMASERVFARSVFLNGTDISSAKVQQLKKVDVKIDERGDIHILAPHYNVQEESTFVPLSAGRVRIPMHENEPLEFRKEGLAPGVVPQFMHGTDKSAKTTENAGAIKEPAKETDKAKDDLAKPTETNPAKPAANPEKN